jgi:hypothetical protein
MISSGEGARDVSVSPTATDRSVPAVVSHIIERMAAAAVADARARYDFGVVLHFLRYGDCATSPRISELAETLGVDTSALHRCARVSEVIAPDEFAWLAELRTERGMPLAWSHIERLARERSGKRRQVLAIEAVREALSVRALDARMKPSKSTDESRETVSKSARRKAGEPRRP